MKKIVVFFVSMISMSIILCGIKMLFLDTRYGDVDSYELNTCFSIENNNKKIMHGECYAYDQCLNEEGQLEFKFELGTYDKRNEAFELSILHDYQQEKFNVKGGKTEIDSYEVELSKEENKAEFSVFLDAEKYHQNSIVIFTLRQDTTQFSSKNSFVNDSNTVNVVIEMVYDETENNDIVDIDADYIDVTRLGISKGSTMFQLSCLNREEDKEIIAQSGEELKMALDIDLYQDVEYIVLWCNLNSKQVNINGKTYCIIKVPEHNTMGRVKLSISIPKKIGQYELEVLGQPINKANSKIYQVMSANRYTIKVE